MNLQEISQLTHSSLNRLTSEQYLEAHNDPTTGKAFVTKVNEIENSPRQATRPAGSVRGADVSEQPVQSIGFDPSFDDAPGATPVPKPAVTESAQPAAPATTDESLPELLHEYQPVDRNGRPVGGLQRFKYRTQTELIEKLTAAHMASSARIRELSRDRRLDELASAGTVNKIPVPTDKVPDTMEELATELRAVRESNYFLAVRAAIADFTASAGWNKYRSKENAESIVLAVTKAGDDPTDVASYHKAFAAMKAFIEPVAQPVVAATVDPMPAPVVEQPKAAAAAPARTAQRVGIPTGLSNADGGGEDIRPEPQNVAPVGIVVGGTRITSVAQWDRVPSDMQKRVLRNPASARIIDSLYAQQAEECSARRAQR
jgi:hypothetical protein